MAKTGKGKASRVAVWIILGLLIVGLAGFGATNFGGSVRSIGRVGDTPIDIARYGRAINDELRALSAQTGQPVSFSQAQQFGLDRAVLRNVVDQVSLENEAARIGVSVGDARVGTYLRDIPAFQGLDGGFDRQGYAFALEQAGMSAAEFESQLRAEIARSLVAGAVAAGTPAPPVYVDTLVTYIAERRDVTWATLTPEALDAPLPDPTEAQLRDQYEATPEAYTTPEIREITYAWITPDRMVDRIDIGEDALRELYDERIDTYVLPERRLVERLVYPDAEAARAARARLDAGEASFEDLVADRGLDLADIDLGDVARDDLSDAAAEAVFALEEPGVTGPVETPLGPALFRMNGILAAQETPFEEARDELRRELGLDRARRAIAAEIEAIDDLLAAGATLEEVAEETALELGTIEWSETAEGGIAGYEAFRTAAATAEQGDFPEVLELEDGGIFALRVDAVRPPELQPLDAVRDAVASDWRQEALRAALAQRAETLAGRLAAGESFEDLGLDASAQDGVTRESFVQGVPSGFLQRLFALDTGETGVVTGPASAVILRLDGIAPPDPADTALAERRAAIRTRAAQSLGQDILSAYTQAVQQAAGIELDQSAINAVHAQLQ